MNRFLRSLGDAVPRRIARAVVEQHQSELEQAHDAQNALSQQVQKGRWPLVSKLPWVEV